MKISDKRTHTQISAWYVETWRAASLYANIDLRRNVETEHAPSLHTITKKAATEVTAQFIVECGERKA